MHQKPLSALEKRGNPWGEMERKRADWTKEIAEDCPVKILEKGKTAETLYFPDSISCFDDRMQEIARATAKILNGAGSDFGILGKAERDSGHEVRRFGEEMLFQDLRDQNTDAILNSGVARIITSDPHAYNALKKDYPESYEVFHYTQLLQGLIKSGKLNISKGFNAKVTYHDPGYLGGHSGVYDEPRQVLQGLPGLELIEMPASRENSLCCGGGGGRIWMETPKEERFSDLRVQQAAETGAEVLVTSCPYCITNFEESRLGLEGEDVLEIKDLTEIVDEVVSGKDDGH